MSIKEIRIEDYLYQLPQDRIAQYPMENRDQSQLLVYREEKITQCVFTDLPDLLPDSSLIIWNNTRVIPARLEFKKSTGASIEIFLLEPVFPSAYASMFDQKSSCIWQVIIGNQKKWKGEILVRIADSPLGVVSLTAEFSGNPDQRNVVLRWSPENLTFAQVLDLFGKTPIPPYLNRDADPKDKKAYQTVYADLDGSVAAPTAGLHFTPELIDKLKQNNIRFNSVTLHVGSGTFVPVKSEKIGDHNMHAETVIVDKSIIVDLLATKPEQLTVVGTTSLRSLESLFWLGQKLFLNPRLGPDDLQTGQWEPYQYEQVIDARQSLESLLNYMNFNNLQELEFITKLIIVPGYRFRLVNRLITNFHQPSSTLLLLVSALVGEKWRDIYDYAMSHNFRFLSYGDSSLLEIKPDYHG